MDRTLIAKRPGPLERHLQRSVMAHLKKLSATEPRLAWRKRHGSAFSVAGDPDIYVLLRGIHIEIELKTPGREATPLQQLRLSEWGRAGACTAVIHSVDELRELLEKLAT